VTGPTAGLSGATLFSSDPQAREYGVITRTTSEIRPEPQIACASASMRVRSSGVRPPARW
jgi:hypothetical protein